LKNSVKQLKILTVTALAACGLAALAASPASASIVPAKFSSTSIKLTGASITFKKNGAEPRTCSISPAASGSITEVNKALPANEASGATAFKCSEGSYVTVVMWGEALYDTVANKYSYRLFYEGFSSSNISPWGNWLQATNSLGAKGTWTNGSGTTQSTIKFENANLGYLNAGGTISLTGTITATTSAGGLLTLSH